MTLTLLRAADRIAQPWKNGGGVTREVAAFPPGSGLDDFLWRVSMAEVAAGGPFSHFAGVDRVLAMLDGEMTLAVEGREAVVLTPDSAPYAFAGDSACEATVAAPVTDLNLMSRRGVVSATFTRAIGPSLAIDAPVALFVATGPATVSGLALNRLDAVLIEGAASLPLDGDGWLIAVT